MEETHTQGLQRDIAGKKIYQPILALYIEIIIPPYFFI
jgi:hypothetical protein